MFPAVSELDHGNPDGGGMPMKNLIRVLSFPAALGLLSVYAFTQTATAPTGTPPLEFWQQLLRNRRLRCRRRGSARIGGRDRVRDRDD